MSVVPPAVRSIHEQYSRPRWAPVERSASHAGYTSARRNDSAGIRVGSDHRLVVEVILTAGKFKEVHVGVSPAAIAGASHRHFGAVDGVKVRAEEDDNIAVERIAPGIECEAWV